ncbi:MAG TPA: hypothetical protein VHY84_17325, partial [Bryobacteraceae bacterium]|nr:hypothetical protein [Bryobacteraceae bacterium]
MAGFQMSTEVMGGLSIVTTPTDIFPYINIPMVGVIWSYNGIQSRILQQQSVKVEQETFNVGLATNYLVIQYQTYLAQAQSTEVAAKGAYVKAMIALDRATART